MKTVVMLILILIYASLNVNATPDSIKRRDAEGSGAANLPALTLENIKTQAPGTTLAVHQTECRVSIKRRRNDNLLDMEGCNIDSLAGFLQEIEVPIHQHPMLKSNMIIEQIKIRADSKKTIMIYGDFIQALDFLTGCQVTGQRQISIKSAVQTERKYNVRFHVLCFQRKLWMRLQSLYQDPEKFNIKIKRDKRPNPPRSRLTPLDVTLGMRITPSYLDHEGLNFRNIQLVKSRLKGEFVFGDFLEVSFPIRGRDNTFSRRQFANTAFFLMQKSYVEGDTDNKAALFYSFDSVRGKVHDIAKALKYDSELQFYSQTSEMAFSLSSNDIGFVRFSEARSITTKYSTKENEQTIYSGKNLMFITNTPLTSARGKTLLVGHLQDKMVITTGTNITGKVEDIAGFFGHLDPQIKATYQALTPDPVGTFQNAKASKTRGQGIMVTCNVTVGSTLIGGLANLSKLNFSLIMDTPPSSSVFSAEGESMILGEVTKVTIKQEDGNLIAKGPLTKAFSTEQLINSTSIDLSEQEYYKSFPRLIKSIIFQTRFELKLNGPANERQLKVRSGSVALGCQEETIEAIFYGNSDALQHSVKMHCKTDKFLHEIMQNLYGKEVVKDQWIHLRDVLIEFNSAHGKRSASQGLSSITGSLRPLIMCANQGQIPQQEQSICGMLKNRLPENMKLSGTFSGAEYDISIQDHSGPMEIDLTKDQPMSNEIKITNAVIKLALKEGNSTFKVDCHLSIPEKGMAATASITELGQGMPMVQLKITHPVTGIHGAPWVSLGTNAKGYILVESSDLLRMVFTDHIIIGQPNSRDSMTVHENVSLTIGEDIRPELLVRYRESEEITKTLQRFGHVKFHDSLDGATFLNGYMMKYCGDGTGQCQLMDHSRKEGKVVITGKIYIFGLTIEANLEAVGSGTKITGSTSMITSDNGRISLQSVKKDGTGPSLDLRSYSFIHAVGLAYVEGQLDFEGISHTAKLEFVKHEAELRYSLWEHFKATWHGETNKFKFAVWLRPDPTILEMTYEAVANWDEDIPVDKYHMKTTLNPYIELAEKHLAEISKTEEESSDHEESLEDVAEQVKKGLVNVENKLEEMANVLSTLQPSLNANCVASCGEQNLFGVSEIGECSYDGVLPCLEWKPLPQTVIDYTCVARCEADKIISRDSIDQNWRRASTMLPKYNNMIKLSNFMRAKENEVAELSRVIQSYTAGVKSCVSSVLPGMKKFQREYDDYSIEIHKLSSTFDGKFRKNVDNRCYHFTLDARYNGNYRRTAFTACLYGKFQKRIDIELFKHIGLELDDMEECLQSKSTSYAEVFRSVEALAAKVSEAIRISESGEVMPTSGSSLQKRTIHDHKLKKFSKVFRMPAGNVVTRGEKTMQAFAQSVPWVKKKNLESVQKFSSKAKSMIFNSSFVPEQELTCAQAKSAVGTYGKLTSSLKSIANMYSVGKKSFDNYKRSLDRNTDHLEMMLFKKYSDLNPGPGDVKDMAYWLMEARKGNTAWMDDIDKSLNYYNKNSVLNLRSQIENFVSGVNPQMSATQYLTALAGAVDATEKRNRMRRSTSDAIYSSSQAQNLISMFSQQGVTLEEAHETISSMFQHGKRLSSLKMTC